MRDLIRLIDTVDCVTPGCPHEAERADGLCRVGRTVEPHRTLTQRRTLPLNLATTGHDQPTYNDHIATLTLHHTDQRCHGCPWPDTCAQDRTCWQQETARASDWQRTRLDLPRSPNAGINTWTRDHAIQAARDWHQRTGRSPSLADCNATDTLPPTSAIYRLFDGPWGWHDAAGIPRTRHGRKPKA